ncbi:methyltransferase [Pseudonocardia nigra]|uniref:methyltransferase n=1 Tax=Pseudonocardia nigra TaxID=1921578 RepID=UPI001FE472CA|nr:methyltransferase [Pseudonocardia nigra]
MTTTDVRIRRAMANSTKGEVARTTLPAWVRELDLDALDDVLGWRDPKAPERGVLLLPHESGLVGIALRAGERAVRTAAMCALCRTITTGTPGYGQRYGRDFWADLDARPELRRSFDAQMNWRFRVQATEIAERFDWSRFSEILDVGGGDGTVLAAILRAHPDLRGRVLDLSPTTTAATDRFAAAGLDDRAGAVSGSFFNPLPVGADAYLLSDILHDWDDDHARKILTGCRRAAASDGTVVVIEPVRGQGADTAMDLFMLMCFGGRERTVDELAKLAADCGLMLHGSGPVADGRTVLEFGVAPHMVDEPG